MENPPKKSGDQTRKKILRVRLNDHEVNKIKTLAKASGTRTISDFVRVKALEVEPVQPLLFPEREVLIRYQADLGKVGSNLNQIARAINRKVQPGIDNGVDHKLINYAINAVEGLTKEIWEILKDVRFRKNKR